MEMRSSGIATAIAALIIAGIQLNTFRLQHTEPFYYRFSTVVTPVVKRGEHFVQDVTIERFRLCEVTVHRAEINQETHEVFGRMQEVGGFSKLGTDQPPARVTVKIADDAPLGKTCMMQRSVSRCIEGIHTSPWPEVCFEVVK